MLVISAAESDKQWAKMKEKVDLMEWGEQTEENWKIGRN